MRPCHASLTPSEYPFAPLKRFLNHSAVGIQGGLRSLCDHVGRYRGRELFKGFWQSEFEGFKGGLRLTPGHVLEIGSGTSNDQIFPETIDHRLND